MIACGKRSYTADGRLRANDGKQPFLRSTQISAPHLRWPLPSYLLPRDVDQPGPPALHPSSQVTIDSTAVAACNAVCALTIKPAHMIRSDRNRSRRCSSVHILGKAVVRTGCRGSSLSNFGSPTTGLLIPRSSPLLGAPALVRCPPITPCPTRHQRHHPAGTGYVRKPPGVAPLPGEPRTASERCRTAPPPAAPRRFRPRRRPDPDRPRLARPCHKHKPEPASIPGLSLRWSKAPTGQAPPGAAPLDPRPPGRHKLSNTRHAHKATERLARHHLLNCRCALV